MALTAASLATTLREGDLIFHTSLSAQSQAIQLATHSPYSHCGLLYKSKGEWQVFEAVQPVKLTPLARWVARGQGQHFVVKRLHDAATALTPAALASLRAAGQPLLGHDYDLAFNWSDKQIYCSELIWKVYARGLHRQLGQLQQLRDFDLRHQTDLPRRRKLALGNCATSTCATRPCKPSYGNATAPTCRYRSPSFRRPVFFAAPRW
jgi:hypothetical protein